MKKAKIMLAGIAMFAVIGGTIAVKASKRSTDKVYTTSTATGRGVNLLPGTTISTTGQLTYATTVFNQPVILTRITAGQ